MANPIIFNEESLSREIISRGFTGQFNWGEALLVAKYAHHILGYGHVRTKKYLLEFCAEFDPFFNYVRNRKTIKKIMKTALDEFKDTGIINIFQGEIDKISKIKNFKQQKVALAALAVSKRKINSGYVNMKDWKTIRKIISRKLSNADIQNTFSVMYGMGLLTPVGASQRILFSEDEKTPVLIVASDSDAYLLIQNFRKLRGGEIGFCRCGKEFLKSSSRKVLCDECSRISRLEKYRRYNEKRFEKR